MVKHSVGSIMMCVCVCGGVLILVHGKLVRADNMDGAKNQVTLEESQLKAENKNDHSYSQNRLKIIDSGKWIQSFQSFLLILLKPYIVSLLLSRCSLLCVFFLLHGIPMKHIKLCGSDDKTKKDWREAEDTFFLLLPGCCKWTGHRLLTLSWWSEVIKHTRHLLNEFDTLAEKWLEIYGLLIAG